MRSPESVKVFVCSSSLLVEERQRILQVIRGLRLQHDSMEYFGARTEAPIEACLREVQGSDLVVVIASAKYGSIVPNAAISFTEAEYLEAKRLGKPCLIYMPETLKTLNSRTSNISEASQRFLETLRNDHVIGYYRDISELATKAASDINREAGLISRRFLGTTDPDSGTYSVAQDTYNGFLRQVDVIRDESFKFAVYRESKNVTLKALGALQLSKIGAEFKRLQEICDDIAIRGSEDLSKQSKTIVAVALTLYTEALLSVSTNDPDNKLEDKLRRVYLQFSNELKPRFLATIRDELHRSHT